jgi:hypothetical protein
MKLESIKNFLMPNKRKIELFLLEIVMILIFAIIVFRFDFSSPIEAYFYMFFALLFGLPVGIVSNLFTPLCSRGCFGGEYLLWIGFFSYYFALYVLSCAIIYQYTKSDIVWYKRIAISWMNVKEFFYPNKLKLSLTGLLFLSIGFFLRSLCLLCVSPIGVSNKFGFPLPILYKAYSGIPSVGPTTVEVLTRILTASAINLLVVYIVTCVLVFIYFKYKSH